MIDHSLLRPELTAEEVRNGCALARTYNIAAVSVKPCDVELAFAAMVNSGITVGTVIGFPHGNSVPRVKAAEAAAALQSGARELDLVINVGRLRGGDGNAVHSEILAVVNEAEKYAVPVKAILEVAYLSEQEIIRGCQLAELSGAAFVKTSTGFAPRGATVDDVTLMRANVSSKIAVKAAGGIRSLETLFALLDAGATRFGTSATAIILDKLAEDSQSATASMNPIQSNIS